MQLVTAPLGAMLALAATLAPPDCAVRLEAASEQLLLDRHAPIVLLAPGERALPASVAWYLARSSVDGAPASTIADAPGSCGESGCRDAHVRPRSDARGGAPERSEWTVYGHVFATADGGLALQYWFFYPFNDFHRLGDHEGDWEHVTVRLDAALRPIGAWYARHDVNAPGAWYAWRELEREGDHPVVLAARGSHASYADPGDVEWYDAACPTRRPAEAEGRRCAIWRTWDAACGGVLPTGGRERPRAGAGFVRFAGRWGSPGAPPGPAYQPGWCAGGVASTVDGPAGIGSIAATVGAER